MRAHLYDAAFAPLTRGWYRALLERLPADTRLLDVGIGTGAALAANAALLRERRIHVTGVDPDHDYVRRCRERMARAGLAERVRVLEEPIEEHEGGPYDAICFSASFMLLDRPDLALAHALGLLAEGGAVFFTQTFEERVSPLIERVKPLLGKFTTIEFGRVTYREEHARTLNEAGLEIVERVVLKRGRRRSFELVESRPASAAAERARSSVRGARSSLESSAPAAARALGAARSSSSA